MVKRRVLIFAVAYHPFVGGAEVAVQEITERLKESFEFHLITLRIDSRLPRKEKIGEVFVYRIGWGKSHSILKLALSPTLTLSKYLFPFWAALKARKLQKKTPFDFTWSIMASYSGFAALFFKFFYPKIPFVLTLQEGDPIDHIKKKVGVFMPLFRKIFTKADIIQTISNFLADFAKSMGYKNEPIVISNGVDFENFSKEISPDEIYSTSQTMGKVRGDVFLITASRLVKKNAVDQIIKALTFLPSNYKFFIAGSGEEEDDLKKLTDDLRLTDRVKFGGLIAHQDLPAYLKASDVFIRPSRSEGMGNSFIEAMAGGIPVIGTKVGGIPDFLIGDKTGLFCEVDDPQSIAWQIKRLAEDKELRNSIVQKARLMALNNYSWENVSKRIKREVFEKILK